ncbi:hypothetical protein [Micromonospora costi]|uniref:DUF1440 domain-containing protein n=1 Tax=Micromonospora costi TaxID=1530042 RepID=A0A3A9ZTT0_9ACTN|nr:hypothetical protein [Micromonospora costi]RKN51655.1 hypothetical protein D7193_27350 [Micromonospora costi]
MRTAELTDGAIAGAVGSTALNVVTYLDMVLRARPASSTPDDAVGRLAGAVHVDLGTGPKATNRRSGLGALLGYATGIGVGVGFALLARGRRWPLATAGGLLGAGAMTMTDGSLTALKVTDPRTWSRSDWISDIVPHLVYGLAAAATWNRLRPPCKRR